MSFIEAEDLGKTYDTNGIKFTALHGVNFMLEEGSLTVILGPSGAGKTTLLNLIGGMDAVTAGRLTVGGKHLEGMNRKELTLYRRADIGFVFQFYNLMPNLTARENIELATEICPDAIDPVKAAEMVGLEEFQDHFPGQLSGGQQQRVSIARAVAKNPKLLLCDEPTGALDIETGKAVLKILSDLSHKQGKTVIIVTHNAAIRRIADRVLSIRNGTIAKDEVNPEPASVDEVDW
ncbi:ABC transporter ATP-binding protein [Pseudoramibacter sp.]|jgi:putative ABC transport system ATP-binding protein|uniref:ABC transporter ATP-binding protein n=1 Tax=Pseudoramibacter sp. TaxID=2034862 RepID=UPI0025E1A0E6|nr:ABC transporter ATP-binding protein [Pseudoramibacter sp.]MCH4071850.1 ABC transporter ATP-binding protein [Pseudoramibacter sp.]MCH4105619.1 ABC transporter ATP-binding protein [Pseudoramibacter sp.]